MKNASITRINPERQWSDVVIFNQTAYFVEVPDSGNDIASQTAVLLAQAERTLAGFGSDKSQLLMATIYIKHMHERQVFNELWAEWLPAGCAPVRACVSAELASPDYLIEIAFTAAASQPMPKATAV